MKWEEVRKLYPDQFVKFEIRGSHVENNKEYVDDFAVIKAFADSKEAMREFIKCKENQFVYSTKHESVIIDLVKQVGIRRSV